MARRPSSVYVCKLLRKSLLLAGKWPDRHQTCTRWSPGKLHPGCAQGQGQDQRSRDTRTFWILGMSYSVIDGLVSVSPHDKLVVLGDFNAESWVTQSSFKHVIGHFGFGNTNSNSSRLLTMYSSSNLAVLSSWFKRKTIHRYSRSCQLMDTHARVCR